MSEDRLAGMARCTLMPGVKERLDALVARHLVADAPAELDEVERALDRQPPDRLTPLLVLCAAGVTVTWVMFLILYLTR